MLRQLDQRMTGDLTVTLLWDSETNVVLLSYEDDQEADGSFRCVVEPSKARFAFVNPLGFKSGLSRRSETTATVTWRPAPRMSLADGLYGEVFADPCVMDEPGGFSAGATLGDNRTLMTAICGFWLICVLFCLITG
jgi:hypothetical protein